MLQVAHPGPSRGRGGMGPGEPPPGAGRVEEVRDSSLTPFRGLGILPIPTSRGRVLQQPRIALPTRSGPRSLAGHHGVPTFPSDDLPPIWVVQVRVQLVTRSVWAGPLFTP